MLTVGALAAGGAGQAWAATCEDPTGQPGQPAGGVLHGVAVRGCKAWAVGFYGPGLTDLTLVEYWNGKSWNVQPSANPGGSQNDNQLYGVAATSSTNAWAIGDYFKGANKTLIERWNGTAWKVQKSPRPGVSELFGVAATSSSNAWAVGSYSRDGGAAPDQALIERWNGTAWKVQETPRPGGATHGHDLNAVAAISRRNAWAVGSYRNHGHVESLVMHWNGSAWKVQKSPNPTGAGYSVLNSVAATSRTNAWAVGSDHVAGILHPKPFILHWNGTAWKLQKAPNPAYNDTELTGVAATSSTNAWAVGFYSGGTLVEHWDGTAWKVQPSPNPAGIDFLYGVAATSSTNAWTIGHYFNDADTIDGPLALHWDGTAWNG